MGKKAAKGPFFFFMLDHQHKNRTNYKMEQLMLVAGEAWTKLEPREREVYEKMAQDQKQGSERSTTTKSSSQLTNLSIPLSHVEQEAKKAERNKKSMENHIMDILQNSNANNVLEARIFHFIKFNYFCKTLDSYLPAEVSVLKYSLLNGIEDVLHLLIKPNEIRRGFAFTAKSHTNDTHQLPMPPNALGFSEFKVINKILDFIRDENELKMVPPFFTMPDDIKATQDILEILLATTEGASSCATDVQRFLVYPLPQLVFDLKNNASSDPNGRFKNIHVVTNQLLLDRYDYTPDIGCDFHQKNNREQFCTQSVVKRYAYMVSDICVAVKDIKLGKHLPEQANLLPPPLAAPMMNETSIVDSTSEMFTCDSKTVDTTSDFSFMLKPPAQAYESDDLNSNFTSVSQQVPQVFHPKLNKSSRPNSFTNIFEKNGSPIKCHEFSRSQRVTRRPISDTMNFSMQHLKINDDLSQNQSGNGQGIVNSTMFEKSMESMRSDVTRNNSFEGSVGRGRGSIIRSIKESVLTSVLDSDDDTSPDLQNFKFSMGNRRGLVVQKVPEQLSTVSGPSNLPDDKPPMNYCAGLVQECVSVSRSGYEASVDSTVLDSDDYSQMSQQSHSTYMGRGRGRVDPSSVLSNLSQGYYFRRSE